MPNRKSVSSALILLKVAAALSHIISLEGTYARLKIPANTTTRYSSPAILQFGEFIQNDYRQTIDKRLLQK